MDRTSRETPIVNRMKNILIWNFYERSILGILKWGVLREAEWTRCLPIPTVTSILIQVHFYPKKFISKIHKEEQ